MGLDTFFGLDDADGQMSPDQVREYKARMARNARQMTAAKQQEGKQKKKEDKLSAILLKFIRNSARKDITLLISRCLEQNIPAVFILAIILLGNKEIQEEVGIHLQLTDGNPGTDTVAASSDSNEGNTSLADLEQKEFHGALVTLGGDQSLPLKMRLGIDLWTRSIWDAIEPIPEKFFKTAVEFSENQQTAPMPKPVVIQLAAFILRDYFKENHFEQDFENVKSFAEFLLKGLLVRLKKQTKEQKQLGGEEY